VKGLIEITSQKTAALNYLCEQRDFVGKRRNIVCKNGCGSARPGNQYNSYLCGADHYRYNISPAETTIWRRTTGRAIWPEM